MEGKEYQGNQYQEDQEHKHNFHPTFSVVQEQACECS